MGVFTMAAYDFVTVDVFTGQRFGGNPLAVFPKADGLTDAQMQAIAREFNLSETTFVLPPDNPRNHARVRIFTPATEMPFGSPLAGHANGVGPPSLCVAADGSVFVGCSGDASVRRLSRMPGRV